MRHPHALRRARQRRSGKVLALFVLLLPVLLGMVGLTTDGGLLLAGQRTTQNAADAAALAAARELLRGQSVATATTAATTFVKTYNGQTNAAIAVNVPPTTGPYKGNSQFVEAIVTNPVNTIFLPLLGVGQTQQVPARAVAGFIAVSSGEGVGVLNPRPPNGQGLSVSGNNTALVVNGPVVVNSEGKGVDENGNPVSYPGYNQGPAVAVNGSGATLKATNLAVVGGVDNPNNYQNYVPGGPNPLHAGAMPAPDPLINLPTPTTANGVPSSNQYPTYNSSTNTWSYAASPQSVSISGGTVTFPPGIYSSIKITGGSITFSGIVVLVGGAQNALNITGAGTTVTSGPNGVMFYNTGSDYNPTTGGPDASDGSQTPAPPSGTQFGGVNLSGPNIVLKPLANTGGPFDGMLFYQRRWNQQGFSTQGNASTNQLSGTLYAKWTNFSISGQGTYSAQFIVGSMSLSGGGNVTLNYSGKQLGKANQVFLVE